MLILSSVRTSYLWDFFKIIELTKWDANNKVPEGVLILVAYEVAP